MGWRGSVYVLLGAVCFATLAIVAKLAYSQGLSTFEVVFLEKALASLILFPVLLKWRPGVLRLDLGQWQKILVLGLFGGTVTSLGFFGALHYVEAGVATILLFTNPVVVLLLVHFWEQEPLQPLHLASLAACLLGGVLVLDILDLSGVSLPAVGIALGVLSSLGLGFLTFYSQRVIRGGVDPLAAVAGSNLVTMLSFLPFLRPSFVWDGTLDLTLWALMGFMALFASVVPNLLLFSGIKLIGAGRASLLATAELPCNVFLAWVILGEQLVPLQLVGGVLVLAGVMAVQRESTRLPAPVATRLSLSSPASSSPPPAPQPGRAGR